MIRYPSLGLIITMVCMCISAAGGGETWKEVRLDGEIIVIRPPTGSAPQGRAFAAAGKTTLLLVASELEEAGRAAAADLERYLPLACGGRVMRPGGAGAEHDFTVLLATKESRDMLQKAGITGTLRDLGEQECLILPVEAFDSGRPGVALIGGSRRGLLNGVYTLLERSAGISWETGRILDQKGDPRSAGAETILTPRESLVWTGGRFVWKPAVMDRVLYTASAPDMVPAVVWASRNRLSHLVIAIPRVFPLSADEEKSLKEAVDEAHRLGLKALFLNMTHRLPVALGSLKPSSPEAIRASTELYVDLVSRFGLDGFAWHAASEAIELPSDPEYLKHSRAHWEARYFSSYHAAIRRVKPDAMLVMLMGWVYMNPAGEMKRLFPTDITAWVVPNTPIIDAALTDIPDYDENFERLWYWQYVTVSRDGAFPMVKLDYLERYFAEALKRGHGLAPQGVFGVNACNAMYFSQVARDGLIPHQEFLRTFGERFYGDVRMGEALLDYQQALVNHRNWYNNVHTTDVENHLTMEESALLKRAFETTLAVGANARSPLLKDRVRIMAVSMLRCFLRRNPHLKSLPDPGRSWTMEYMGEFGWNRRSLEEMVRRYEEVFAPVDPVVAGDFFGEEFVRIRTALRRSEAAGRRE